MGIFEQCAAPNAAITHNRRLERSIDELIGICRGILADGAINVSEARFLDDWLHRHVEFSRTYPFDVLIRRLHDALSSGVLEHEEEAHLLEALSKLVGGETQDDSGAHSLSCALPLDEPEPPISYADEKAFAVAGVFAFGPRARVVHAIQERGGCIKAAISRNVDYLVIGEVGSRDWMHSSFGRKIEEAVALRTEGVRLAIVCERHWSGSLA